MMKPANCVVSITCAKIAHGVVAVLARVLADRNQAASSRGQAANLSVARWVLMPHIRVLVRRVAMLGQPLVKNARITLAHAMIILVIVLKAHVLRVPPVIAHKLSVRLTKIAAHVRKAALHKVSVLLTKIAVHALKAALHKASVRPIKTVVRAHHARLTAIRPNSVAGMCPMVSIPAHG